jgi:hypothetical protein
VSILASLSAFIHHQHDTILCPTLNLCNKAVELAESGHYNTALDLVNRGIKPDGKNAHAWYNKGIILFKIFRYKMP